MAQPDPTPPGGRGATGPAAVFAEDLTAGSVYNLGSHLVSHDEIVRFARDWDPQPFHVDDAAAATGHFGEVIASGLHTLGIFQRLAVAHVYRHWSVVAGRALRDVQFLAPVRPRTLLSGTLTVESIDADGPGRSLVTQRGVLSSVDAPVLTLLVEAYVRTRPVGDFIGSPSGGT